VLFSSSKSNHADFSFHSQSESGEGIKIGLFVCLENQSKQEQV
jgi:hypothetical protein